MKALDSYGLEVLKLMQSHRNQSRKKTVVEIVDAKKNGVKLARLDCI